MARFDEYITGKLEVKVGKENLELDINIDDKRKLKALAGGVIDEAKLKIIDDCFLAILGKSYPNESSLALEGFYVQNDTEFLNAVFIRFGWLKASDLEEKKK